MPKSRVEAFSDAVIAIIITIMVLELRAPHGENWWDLNELIPVLIAYILSFFTIAVFWINHHHLFHQIERVDTPVLWTNIHFLFWLSLFPLVTSWVSETHFAPVPVALYGIVLLVDGIAVWLVAIAVSRTPGVRPEIAMAGRQIKSLISNVIIVIAIGIAFFAPLVALVLYFVEGGFWLVPDWQIERFFRRNT